MNKQNQGKSMNIATIFFYISNMNYKQLPIWFSIVSDFEGNLVGNTVCDDLAYPLDAMKVLFDQFQSDLGSDSSSDSLGSWPLLLKTLVSFSENCKREKKKQFINAFGMCFENYGIW